MLKIALFGTSADPPTLGHQAILQWLSQHYDQVFVWASENPFKEHGTTLDQRMAMLQLLIDDLGFANVQLEERLSDRRSLNTVHKAKAILGEEPDFFLVIGSDLITQIPHWYRAKDLLQQVKLLIFPRQGYPIETVALQQLQTLDAQWQTTDYFPPAVSSSAYRHAGESQVIIPAIAAYIQAHNLYPKSAINNSDSDD